MASQLGLPLPEITFEDFHRSWTRFELVASAKEWDAAKQKLMDIYDDIRGDLKLLKKALMMHAGLVQDPLSAGQQFMARHQLPNEKVNDYALDLKKLFTESYPSEAMTVTTFCDGSVTIYLSSVTFEATNFNG